MNRSHKTSLLLCFVFLTCIACSINKAQYAATAEPTRSVVVSAAPVTQPAPLIEPTPRTESTSRGESRTPFAEQLATFTEALPSTSTSVPPLTPEPVELTGPLALVVIESVQQSDLSAAIFAPEKATIRRIDFQDERPSAAQWLRNGCELFLNGKVYDLRGDAIWQVPLPVESEQGSFYVDRLSPLKNWLASPIFSGLETYDSTEFVDVETTSLTPPYSSYRLSQRGGAEADAFVWSSDEEWVYFSDYDVNGILQIMRATPDGQIQEQLTQHEWVLGQVNSMAISPDGQYLAYGVLQALPAGYPYQYAEADEGWIGIIDVDGDSVTQVRLPKFGGVFDGRGLWWNAAGNELLIVGDSLPVPNPDPVAGTQIHWVRINEGGIPYRSVYDAETPGGTMGWVIPVSADLNTLFLNTRKGYYLLEDGEFREYASEPLSSAEKNGRIIDFISGPTNFPGEAVCGE